MQPPTQPRPELADQPTLAPNVDSAASAAPPRPAQVGAYDLLEEIARGGMGVVFRARHRQLGRLVALKMILAGQLASSTDVQRFRVEAEAAAQLDHPGIVPIYEIGEFQGQPFFAMKLVEGENLAQRMKHFQSDLRAGGAVLAQVARAVQHAHERGILHRDLKPSNILLDADDQPLVTDFGLAKHLASGGEQRAGSLTQSGAIVGTPSYMAPEQVSGARQVTIAADVYALGAILYEVLTGRPPHVGPTSLEVLVRVLEENPTPPRELNPHVDRDLEAICLKCLARQPAERYTSAADLADDLEHWRAGEPIGLRPAALATQLRSWLQQNLRTAGRTLAVGLTFGLLLGLVFWLAVSRQVAPVVAIYDLLPGVSRPWVLFAPVLPMWILTSLPVLMMLILGSMGFVTAVVVRPTTRHAAVAAGLGVGFLTSVSAFTLGIGEGVVARQAIHSIEDDLAVLSTGAFTRAGPGDPQPGDRLLAKYADLTHVAQDQRGPLLQAKIIGDLFAGIITGLWWGTVFALAICLVPGVTGTVAAWSLMERHGSAPRALLPYAELAVTVTILTAIVVGTAIRAALAGRDLPEAAWLVALWAACGFGVLAVGLRWPIYWRLLIHGAWIGVIVCFFWHEADFRKLEDRGVALVQAGQLDEAAKYFDQVLRRQPDQAVLRFETAIVCLRAGDEEAYRRHCRELLVHARETTDPRNADRAAKASLIGGDRIDDLPLVADLADRAVQLGAGDSAKHFFQMVRGMAAYRQGKNADALRCLGTSREADNPYISSTAFVFEAMTWHRLNRPDEARAALTRGDDIFHDLEASFAKSPSEPLGPQWVDVLIFRIVRQEAATIGIQPNPKAP
jgi:hypothetical protein